MILHFRFFRIFLCASLGPHTWVSKGSAQNDWTIQFTVSSHSVSDYVCNIPLVTMWARWFWVIRCNSILFEQQGFCLCVFYCPRSWTELIPNLSKDTTCLGSFHLSPIGVFLNFRRDVKKSPVADNKQINFFEWNCNLSLSLMKIEASPARKCFACFEET